MKVLIVGGVAGGASTAARLRRNDENAEIIVFEKGKEVSYANCGIPYYIGDVIKDRSLLELLTPEDFKKMLNVDVRNYSEVIEIDRKNKTVTVMDHLNNKKYQESYDKLVLSPGGNPIKPPLPGIGNEKIFTIRNLADMDKIKTFINTHNPKKAVVIGAGFIGLEIAENLNELGIKVSIVELADQVMNVIDYEMATVIHQHLHAKNIGLYLKDGVKEFKENEDNKLEVVLNSNRTIMADIVMLSIGIKPDTTLAKQAGITLGALGGILTNSKMQTSDKDIYALGDATEIKDCVLEKMNLIPLANSANKQGRIVADNLCGIDREYISTTGAAIAKIFDMVVGTVGSNEKNLIKNNINYSKVYLQPSSHAGYYPNAFPLMMKLIYSRTDFRVLGAQLIGAQGIDKRIDVIATLLQSKGTIYDLARLELSYAPPFNSAKDPVNIAAMIAINQVEGKNDVIFWNEVNKYKQAGALFLDVRDEMSYDLDHIDTAINIPLTSLREKLEDLPKDKDIIVYCNQGKTAYFALNILNQNGFTKVKNLSGGIKLFKFTTFKQENIGIFDDDYIDKKDDVQKVIAPAGKIIKVDACGMQCPGPIMRLAKSIELAEIGDTILIESTDQGFQQDVGVWADKTNNELISLESIGGKITAQVKKGKQPEAKQLKGEIPHDKTLVVFSGDLDKAIAAFIIANGGAAMGRKVTMFFTFWGLNILRKEEKVTVKKDILGKMFGFMMPKGSKKLGLSKMNMAGMGPMMIKMLMKQKNVTSLEGMIKDAMDNGVKIIACQMSMDLMGFKQEELLEGVEIGGVATYLGAAESADNNLFI
ncbi:MAG: FAD-dependent oxidoreductase [Candidatus Margulisbacteria bacterium]|nr:FAD-dependent oxidoreductase [Candidatus Margulisiibacteriota bacterium]